MGLKYLHQANNYKPTASGKRTGRRAFEPRRNLREQRIVWEICKQRSDWSLIDVHSGIYMLGTRDPRS